MMPLPQLAGFAFGAVTLAGMVQAVAGAAACRRFSRAPRPAPQARPSISVLKPLHGDEPGLEAALESFFTQAYPSFQLVLGVQSPTDPAIRVVERLRARYPAIAASLVIDDRRHGLNRKISNILNMMPEARHELLVLADSDVLAAPELLDRLVATLEQPGTGIATTLYSGRPAAPGPVGGLGASHITHSFLPGALLARSLGRQDCLGATIALRRETLAELGGFAALSDQLADDAVLGQLARLHGYRVALAPAVPATTVAERALGELVQHEMRWARTIRSLAPLGHGLSLIQFPIVWAMLGVAASGGAGFAWLMLGGAIGARAASAMLIERALGLPPVLSLWLLPVRDWMSALEVVASLRGGRVRWRGEILPVGRPLEALRAHADAAYRAAEPALGRG